MTGSEWIGVGGLTVGLVGVISTAVVSVRLARMSSEAQKAASEHEFGRQLRRELAAVVGQIADVGSELAYLRRETLEREAAGAHAERYWRACRALDDRWCAAVRPQVFTAAYLAGDSAIGPLLLATVAQISKMQAGRQIVLTHVTGTGDAEGWTIEEGREMWQKGDENFHEIMALVGQRVTRLGS